MKPMLKKKKSDSDYKLYELTLPNSWESVIPFLKDNPLIWFALDILLIFYTVWAGNLVLFGLVLRIKYLFAIYLLFQVVYRLDSRISIGLGLFSLIWSTNFLVSNQGKKAELLAIYAYVFLGIGVCWQFYELFIEGRKAKK